MTTITTPEHLLHTIACEQCGTVFRQNSTNQKCCSKRCRTRGERIRARERQGAPAVPLADPRLLATVHSPSADDVLRWAQAVLAVTEKSVLFTGAVPVVTVPHGTMLIPQSDGTTLLTAGEVFDLDAFLRSTVKPTTEGDVLSSL